MRGFGSLCRRATVALGASALVACAPATPGPDKQFAGALEGAALGAGSGAITGFHVAAASGPGAAIGAGFGAVVGGIQGLVADQEEEAMLALAAERRGERSRAQVHETLSEHYQRRLELHPTRDIYPADLFFDGDEVDLKPGAVALIDEMARLNKRRLPWSRLVVAAYAKSSSPDSEFARHLTERRSRAIGDQLIRGGIEPRRIVTRAVVIDEPVLIDPHDKVSRYNQAIEIIPADR
jgi:outer membrane protein OmpA-like peptidoglycan-associated protein